MRQFFMAVFILLSLTYAFSQHSIKGRVTDEKGLPLQGASVFIPNESIGKSTNHNGEFIFHDMKNKIYNLEISFVGFEKLIAQASSEKFLTVVLKSKSVNINEITVTSLRANDRSAVAYSDVKKEEIEQRNLGQDIPYLLALTPSFITTSDAGTGIGYTGFRIRGTDANRTNITVNGIPLNDPESHGTFFVNMPDFASSLSSVQVQRGVGTSTNGAAAFGASINMQTEGLNATPYAEVSSTIGSFKTNKNTLKAGTGMMYNGFSFDARLSNVTSDGYIDRAWVDMKSYYFSAGYYADKTTLKFLTFGGNEKTYQAWNGVDSEIMKINRTYNELGKYTDNSGNVQFYDNQTDNYTQTHYQLHWLQELNNRLQLNATAHYTKGVGYYEEYKEARKYKEYGLIPDTIAGKALKRTDLIRQKWLDNDFYGLTFALNYNTKMLKMSFGGAVNRYDGDHFGKVIWVRNGNKLNIGDQWYQNNGLKDDANFYLKTNVEPIKNLFAVVDLQYRYINYRIKGTDSKYDDTKSAMYDITQSDQFNFFNPKFGLTYKIDPLQEVYASYSISNREPNRNNYKERGPHDAKPTHETLYDTEAGYRFNSPRFAATANFFYMKYKNQLILTGKISEIGEMLTANMPDSYRLGIEITAVAKITDALKWDGNISLSRNKILSFTEEDVDMYDAAWKWVGTKNNILGTTDIAYSPNVVANSILSYNFDNFELCLYSNFVGKQYFDNTSSNDRAIDAYFVNNFSVKYAIQTKKLKGINIKLLINNIFNDKYENNAYSWYSYYIDNQRMNEKRYFPQAGTNFLCSLTFKF
ncbi:MAG: TonB-dependent receptor [Paludibacter sp.]|nr:TonB-dependent receptor [Paludibacter sp.]